MLSITPIGTSLAARLVQETQADATPENNVATGAGSFYAIEIDNTANPGTAVYLKLYNNAAPTVGTTATDWKYRCAGGARRTLVLAPSPEPFTALSLACTTEAADTGTTSPAAAVVVRIVIS